MLAILPTRGGVEDTRLEAKAKDTKKSEAKAKDSLSEDRPSRGQGQECSRPRTKDTAARVFQKKTSSKEFFRQSLIYRRRQNFWLGRLKPQITCNDVIKNLPVFHLTRILQRERASTNIVEKCKYVTLETFWENQCNSNVSQTGVWGRSLQLLGGFL